MTKEITEVHVTASQVPDGLAVSASGVVTGTPTCSPDVYQMQVGATTNYGQTSGTVTVNVEGSEPTEPTEPTDDPEIETEP